MRLIFIGTSHGVPEADRRCSSYILETGGNYYLIDMGTQVIEDLRKRSIPVEKIRLVICSHAHGDHTDGLISFVDLINWYFKNADPLILLPDRRLIPPMREWIIATNEGKPLREGLRMEEYSEGAVYEDECLKITALRTKHCENSYAFLIEGENKSILFTNDLNRPSVDFPGILTGKKPDLLVCEAAHFSPDECIPYFDEAKAGKVLFTHVYDRRWNDVLTRQMSKTHPYELGVASDGTEVVL